MILGEMLMTGTTARGPWFRRLGDAVTFFCDAVAIAATTEMEISIETKNTEDADSAATSPVLPPLASSWIVNATGSSSIRVSALKELVRFQYIVSFTGGGGGQGFIHFRMPPPAWEVNVAESLEGCA